MHRAPAGRASRPRRVRTARRNASPDRRAETGPGRGSHDGDGNSDARDSVENLLHDGTPGEPRGAALRGANLLYRSGVASSTEPGSGSEPADAPIGDENDHELAESEGFEPPNGLPRLLISNQVPSAARPALPDLLGFLPGLFCIRPTTTSSSVGGEGGIRTHDTLPYTRFPSVRLRPLGHLSRTSYFLRARKNSVKRAPHSVARIPVVTSTR